MLGARAVMVSTLPGLPVGLRALGPEDGPPELPETAALLLKARQPRQPVTEMLAEHIPGGIRARTDGRGGSVS